MARRLPAPTPFRHNESAPWASHLRARRSDVSKLPLAVVLLVAASVVPAGAAPILVSFATTGVGPLTFHADTFSESGASGTLTLDTTAQTTNVINNATMTVGDSGFIFDSESLVLTFTLTLDGISHQLSQSATWTLTPTQDSFLAFAASSPVRFSTSLGRWDVTLQGFTIVASAFGDFPADVSAEFSVPEPASLTLFGTALVAALRVARRRGRSPTP
jgi:hypothetical protein